MSEPVENQNIEQKEITQENIIEAKTEPAIEKEETEVGDVNWRAFREKRKEERKLLAERERELQKKKEEAEALKKALEAMATPSYTPQTVQLDPYQYNNEKSEEDRILEKVNVLLEKREREREEQRRQQEHAQYPERLKSNYVDFNHVCNTENLDYLEYHYPEVARPLAMLPDSYEKWEGIYKAVKRFIPNLDKEKDMKKIEKNLNKPVAMSRPGMTSTADQAPHIALTDDQRAKNWERMRKLSKTI